MARKRKNSSAEERHVGSNGWPSVASPVMPPTCGIYYWRVYSDGREEMGGYHNFLHVWQMGRFLLEVLEGAEEIEHEPLPKIGNIEDDRPGSTLTYLIVTERDANGDAVKGRRFRAKIVGATFEEAIAKGKLHTDIRLPYTEDTHRRAAQGRPPRSYAAWEADDDNSSMAASAAPVSSKRERKAERAPRAERGPRAPRASRDGLLSLTEICADEKIEAGDVRAQLRAMKVEKPASGWAWPKDEVPAYVAKAIKAAKEKRK